MRNCFFPSLQNSAVFTISFAQVADATFAASIERSELMVPTLLQRMAGPVTNGVVYPAYFWQ